MIYLAHVYYTAACFFHNVIVGYDFERARYPLTHVYIRREVNLMYVGFAYSALRSKEKPISECPTVAPIHLNGTKYLPPVTLEDFRAKDFHNI